ncbi:MAG TPA: aminotransferase class III-fold pyridoxal phosphate-dependent enzyme, partial [Fervidobacterium sp.]|nr:aminotransferase class III-fold pyridoxal phosphate-dependent enzyme [Fervidobacterium sp.]
MSYVADTYSRFPIRIAKANGMNVWDDEGREYIDTFMGIGVLLFGHNHPVVVQAMKQKMDHYVHLSNFFADDDAEVVAERLVMETGRNGKVFFTNSGAESSECALKVVRKTKKTGKIVSFVKNFHGRTMKSLSITGFDDLRRQFVDEKDVVFLPYDVNVVEEFFEKESDIAAVFVEVLHGSGGLDLIPTSIVELINHYKSIRNFILIADEVQSGLGRTGKFYAYQHFDLKPDLVTLAKGIGGGLPLGGCIMLDDFSDVFVNGDHGSTFAPNPVALAGGRAVLSLIND